MIDLPAGFDLALLLSDFYTLVAPFLTLGLLISFGVVVLKIFRRI
jgi:hypothetical protein